MRLRLGGAKSQTRGCQEQIHWKPGTQLLYGEDIRTRVWSIWSCAWAVHASFKWPVTVAIFSYLWDEHPWVPGGHKQQSIPSVSTSSNNPEAEGSICPQDVPRLFHYKSLHLSGEEVLSQLADKSRYKRRLMPGWAVEELALATAKRTLFSRPTNSIKPQDKFLSSSLIPFHKVSVAACRYFAFGLLNFHNSVTQY